MVYLVYIDPTPILAGWEKEALRAINEDCALRIPYWNGDTYCAKMPPRAYFHAKLAEIFYNVDRWEMLGLAYSESPSLTHHLGENEATASCRYQMTRKTFDAYKPWFFATRLLELDCTLAAARYAKVVGIANQGNRTAYIEAFISGPPWNRHRGQAGCSFDAGVKFRNFFESYRKR